MCGRYFIDSGMYRELERWFRLEVVKRIHGDIHPSEIAPVIDGGNKAPVVRELAWGLPRYGGNGLIINARAESVWEKPAFRDGIRDGRCVIPASCFYEWDRSRNMATFKSHGSWPLYMAGFHQMTELGERFVIITTRANDSVKTVHHRMPLLLSREEVGDWIYDSRYAGQALDKVPEMLDKEMTYEQLSLFDTL